MLKLRFGCVLLPTTAPEDRSSVDVVLSGMNTMAQLLDSIGDTKDFRPMNEKELRIRTEAVRL